jgi:hypothetical protein
MIYYYDDILGEKDKNKKIEQSTESLIRSLKYNVKKKQKMIDNLLNRVTELERQLEAQNQHTHAGI